MALAVLLALLAVALVRTPEASAAPPAYYPSGPQVNVSESQLTGWTQCWSGLYNGTVSLATVLAACQGDYLLLAGGPVGSTTFDVVAAAPRADVIHDTGNSNTPHDANGTGWYYSSSRSWGFAKQGDAINRITCDVLNVNPAQRLCWHTSGGNMTGGYRSGSNTGLNGSTAYRRVIYVASEVVVSGEETRAGYCLGGRFLDLVSDQPTTDAAYFGATPAIFVAGLGITCDPPPADYARSGFAGAERHVRAGLHPLYLPQT
jgi:hypothetical protein